MGECYSRELGRPVGESEARRIWRGIIEKQTPASIDELRCLGHLMTELTERFAARHAQSPAELHAINVLAAQIWHEIVDRSLGGLGQAADKVREEFVRLQAWTPSGLARMKSRAVGVISGYRARQRT